METVESTFKKIINSLFFVLLLHGLTYIGTGVLIFFHPQIINALVIAGFVWLGLTSVVAGLKVKKFGKQVKNQINKQNYSI